MVKVSKHLQYYDVWIDGKPFNTYERTLTRWQLHDWIRFINQCENGVQKSVSNYPVFIPDEDED